MLFLAVAVFGFLATGVGGSEVSGPGAFRFPEPEALCTVCAMQLGRMNMNYQYYAAAEQQRNQVGIG